MPHERTYLERLDSTFLHAHKNAFEDFWNWQLTNSIPLEYEFDAFGFPVQVQTNDTRVLDAARLSAARYAKCIPVPDAPPVRARIIMAPHSDAAPPLPSDFASQLRTFAVGDYLFQALTPWVQWFTDLDRRAMFAFIDNTLAESPRLVSRYLLDRAFNNIALRSGLGQLHATSLLRGKRAFVLIAPHGTGKSTTAFHLLNAGYKLMGDGILFIRPRSDRELEYRDLELIAYPVGEAKLTREMQAIFPQWRGEGEEVTVHKVNKHIVNLRTLAPDYMVESSVFPREIVVCLTVRDGNGSTRFEPLEAATTLELVLPDSVYVDQPESMLASLESVRRLLERAKCYRLTLGSDPAEIVRVIENL